MKAFTSGCAGTALSAEERSFFRAESPWGLILFARNIETRSQVLRLCDEFRRAVDDEARPVLIDQEGGRVQRMRAPLAPDYPTNDEIGRRYTQDRARTRRVVYLLSRLHAFDLQRVGVDVNCLPVLDIPAPNADPIIGTRAYSREPAAVSDLGQAACDGLLAGGVLPVIKHLPGHGRADVDSHKQLPRVNASLRELANRDFLPFAALADMPLGMTAHVVFEAIDLLNPATQSKIVVRNMIRGAIAFDGLLMSDDISMHALSGSFEDRTRKALDAGCDIALHCNGVFSEMRAVASVVPEVDGECARRSTRALAMRHSGDNADEAELREEFEELTGWNVDIHAY